MARQSRKSERIDIRITPEEKDIFIMAQSISGESTLSGFFTRILKKASFEIIEENERVLASERDRNIFFDAIFSDYEPNETLKEAAKKFNARNLDNQEYIENLPT